jgi:hypothetical protein
MSQPEDDWPEDDQPAPPWPGPPGFGVPGGQTPRRRHTRPLIVAVIAMAGAAAGAAIALFLVSGPTTSPSAASTASPPSAAAPGDGNGAFPGGAGGGNGIGGGSGQMLFLGGKVTAISGTSITITGQGQDFTAAITSSTRFTGVHGASGIKTGDLITAQISGYGTGHPVATAIQDPAQMP